MSYLSVTTFQDAFLNKFERRDLKIDRVRITACITVIVSHFFIHTDFAHTSFRGLSMWLQGAVCSFQVGSDLFMLLSGYLLCQRLPEPGGWRGWQRVMGSYISISLLSILISSVFQNTSPGWKDGLAGILSFQTIPYAWYIEMWIGLFLMAPWLNVLFNNLDGKKNKLVFLAAIFAITALPDFTNRYNLYILPQFWTNLYPIFLYYCGAYIRTYNPRIRTARLTIALMVMICITPTLNLVLPHDTYLHIFGGRGGILVMPMAVTTFLLIYSRPAPHTFSSPATAWLAYSSLDIFLSSAIIDSFVYPWARSNLYSSQHEAIFWILPIVLVVLVLSATMAAIRQLASIIITRIIGPCIGHSKAV